MVWNAEAEYDTNAPKALPKHIARQAGICKRVIIDDKKGGFAISACPSNSIAPLAGSLITSFTITAKAIPVNPKKIKTCLQFTSSLDVPISDAVAKYAAMTPNGIPIE